MSDVSVVIPNLNGEKFLQRCIQSILSAFEVYPGNHEIVLVDNGSKDRGVEIVHSQFPSVRIIEMGRNTGFAGACNEGISKAKNEIIILLNNDTHVKNDFLYPLVHHFENNDLLFGVSCKLVRWDEKTFQTGRNYGVFHKGIIESIYTGDCFSSTCSTFHLSGSASALSRDKFIKLGGFGRFNRWNDTDLSYRARKRGWEILYEPKSIVYHWDMATDRSLWTDRQIRIIRQKEMFIVIWRNITDKRLLLQHIFFLPLLPIFLGFRTTFVGFLKALVQLPAAIRHRWKEKPYMLLSDREVFEKCRCES